MATRYLRLLGPARVDLIQRPHNQAVENRVQKSGANVVPRFRSRRTVALLGYLVAERRPTARDLLAALFWPDEAQSKGRGNLRRELHNLSQILPDCWQMERQAVAFIPTGDTAVDIYTLMKLEAEERWGEAVELLGGEFLEGLYLDDNLEFETWLLGERERWRVRTEAVLTRVIEGHTLRGQYADALQHCQRLLQLAPWNEGTHRQVMRLLAWTGQRGAALRQYDTCNQVLKEELDVEPSAETEALYHQIRDSILDVPPQLPAFLTEEGARHEIDRPLFVAREHELTQLESFLDAALDGQGRMVFITGGPGRGKTALMNAFGQRAMETHPDLLVASGNCYTYSGVGDPYLPFRDMMAMLTGDVETKWDAGGISRSHARRLWAAFPFVVLTLLDYAPQLLDVFLQGVALLSRAMTVTQADTSWITRLRKHVKRQATGLMEVEQSHLFQQMTNLLLNLALNQPLLLFLDDMQWADVASTSLVFHLGRRLSEVESRILIVCAYRSEEVAIDRAGERHPLAKPLSEFKRTFGDVWVDLGRTDVKEGRRFVDALIDSKPNRLTEEFRAALHHRTGGHPLFTVELLRAMQERDDLLKDEEGYLVEASKLDWELLPARVEAVIEERIDRLDQELQDVLTVASIEGEVFTAQVVAEVQKIPERLLLRKFSQELERRHRLVSEEGEVQTGLRRMSRYKFRHVLFQDYLYKRLSLGERRLLHEEVATALEKLYDGSLDEMAVQLAHHFLKADDYSSSFQYFILAAERAARLYAYDEAIRHYTRAIELAERVSPDNVTIARLHHGRGLAFETIGEFDQARADFEAALHFAHTAGEYQEEWRVLLDLGKLWASRDYNKTRDYFERALELARRMDDQAVLAGSLNWIGNWYANDENPLRAVECHQEALRIFKGLGNQRNLANTLDLLGIEHLLSGDLTASAEFYDQAIALFRELNDRSRLISSLMGRATIVSMLVLLASVPPALPLDAQRGFEEAIRIAQEIDSAPDVAWAHWSRGLLYTVQGQFGPALDVIQDGIHIASEIGHREWEVGNRFALGVLYGELFAPEFARQQLEKALNLAQELQSRYWVHHVTGALAAAYYLLDDQSLAQTCLEKVLSPQTPMDTMGKRYCWARRAELALAQGDPALALEITDRLITSAPGILKGQVITFLWMLKGNALAAIGLSDEACSLLHAARENAQATGERFLLCRIQARLERLSCFTENGREAEADLPTARMLIEELATTIPDEALKKNFLQGALKTLRPLQ